jgi:hypothetical protein
LLSRGFLQPFNLVEDTPLQEIRMKIREGKRNREAMKEVSSSI